ncbi:hypothetical protein J6590_011898 [Homalodisca vitripennis]|nr:hypothetical protein J6590_011898 [Homalodisca vitripennis]
MFKKDRSVTSFVNYTGYQFFASTRPWEERSLTASTAEVLVKCRGVEVELWPFVPPAAATSTINCPLLWVGLSVKH